MSPVSISLGEPLFFTITYVPSGKNTEKSHKRIANFIDSCGGNAPTPSRTQIGIDVPGVGVRIGEPNRDRRVYRDRREFREREVRGGQGCKTVTIERDDGSVKRIRKCDWRTEFKRIHLCPLDCADDLPSLTFGPNCIRKITASELEAIVDSALLRRTNSNWIFDAKRFSQFTWLLVEEIVAIDREPAARAVPGLFTNLNRDFAEIEPHKGRFPAAVEAALAAVLMAPWEDWVEYEDVDWRAFRIPWVYTVVDDIFQRAAPPPSPDSLSWEPGFVQDQHGDQVEVESPTRLPVSDRVSNAPEWLSNHALAELLRARQSVLFGNPVAHFLVRAFLSDDIDEFLAHITVVEAALGLSIDHLASKRPKLLKGENPGATRRVAARLSALLQTGSAGSSFQHLFNTRSEFVHGRAMASIPGRDRNLARRLARQAAVAITKAALAEDAPASREAYLNGLLTAGYTTSI